jgi:hypothetical protein
MIEQVATRSPAQIHQEPSAPTSPSPPPGPPPAKDGVEAAPSSSTDTMFAAAPTRAEQPPTPGEALQRIADLEPYVDSIGRQTGRGGELYAQQLPGYNRMRAEIADKALASAQPPKREDYAGNQQLYNLERQEYDQQIAQLKQISAEAKAFPDRSPQAAHELYQKVQSIEFSAPAARSNPAAAKQVAQDLAALKGQPDALKLALDRAFAGQTPDEVNATIKAVLKAGVSSETVVNPLDESGMNTYTNHDATLAGQVLEAVASGEDATMKANFFRQGTEVMGELPPADAENVKSGVPLRNGLTSIIDSDTNGVVGKLDDLDESGRSLTSYMKDQLTHGQEAHVKTLVARMVYGNELKEDAFTRIDKDFDPSNRESYKNAEDLGYLLGSVGAAVDQMAGERADETAVLKNIIGTTAGGIATAGPGPGVPAMLVSGGVNAIADQALTNYREGLGDLKSTLIELALPRYPSGEHKGEVYGGDARNAFNSRIGRVQDANRLPG